VALAKGRPMLRWVGKHAIRDIPFFPAQHIERFGYADTTRSNWNDWPQAYEPGGLLFHGDNKEVLGNLLANGFRGRINLIYIDPPFASAADYVRQVTLRGAVQAVKLEGADYSQIEQVQYTDIWTNDNYLQFLYERLLLLRELLAPDGSIWVHCDWHKSHHIRCLLEEVFASDNLVNEVIWQRTDPHNDAKSRLGWVHDTLFWFKKGEKVVYNWESVVDDLSPAALREYSLIRNDDGTVESWNPAKAQNGRRFKLDDCTYKGNDPIRRFEWRGARPSNKRVWPYADAREMDAAVARGEFFLRKPAEGAARCRVSYLDEREGQVLQTIWTECGRMKGGSDYPTQKPEALLDRIISAASSPGDLVLDCFLGSGTTAAVAQKLGRRWIGCDINLGAIHTTARRLQRDISEQLRQHDIHVELDDSPAPPAQTKFNVYRVNDYDLQIQHNEALSLVVEHLGLTATPQDEYFDGTLGISLVKVIPLNHPLTIVDLQELKDRLAARSQETRTITIVALGVDNAAKAWVADWNALRQRGQATNAITLVDLKTDRKYGGVLKYEKPRVKLDVTTANHEVIIEIVDFISPTVLSRLQQQAGVLSPQIKDWRSIVDAVLIDPDFDGNVFNAAVVDAPEERGALVRGLYHVPVSEAASSVAVKLVSVLGEELLTISSIGQRKGKSKSRRLAKTT
jgi:DNA modification methylase